MPEACVHGVGSTIPLRSRRDTEPASRPPVTRGARSAATSRSVDAPAPSAPTSATTSPCATSSDTPRKAGDSAAGYQKLARSSVKDLMRTPGRQTVGPARTDTPGAGPSGRPALQRGRGGGRAGGGGIPGQAPTGPARGGPPPPP